LDDFVGAKFYCPHALADGNQRIRINNNNPCLLVADTRNNHNQLHNSLTNLLGEKTLVFSSTVLSTLSPLLRSQFTKQLDKTNAISSVDTTHSS